MSDQMKQIAMIFEETMIVIKQMLKAMIIGLITIFIFPIRIIDCVCINFINVLTEFKR